MRYSEHFTYDELACKCGCDTPSWIEENLRFLAHNLEILREVYGSPITVTSGYRCPDHNERQGGVQSSMHLHGKAADIKVTINGMTVPGERLRGVADCLIGSGELHNGGLGTYKDRPNILHYDVRSTAARWGP